MKSSNSTDWTGPTQSRRRRRAAHVEARPSTVKRLLIEGDTCWRRVHAARAAVLVDAASYFEVIDADRSVLQQRRTTVQLDGERARTTVALIRALGGGWDAPAGHALAAITALTDAFGAQPSTTNTAR